MDMRPASGPQDTSEAVEAATVASCSLVADPLDKDTKPYRASTDPKRFTDDDLLERDCPTAVWFLLEFMLDTSLSDADSIR